MVKRPDYETAAIKAMEIIEIKNIRETPIDPLPILKTYPRVKVFTFANAAVRSKMERKELVALFGKNQDAATFRIDAEEYDYIVFYNQFLPFEMIWRGVARELGHIVLGHDGQSRSMEVRMEEAYCFAHHLLCPRPLIHAIQESGIRLTMEVLGNITGCYEQCLDGIRKTPGVHVPPELNKRIRSQFTHCLDNFIDFQPFLSPNDKSALADFGTYMDYYEE